MVQTSQSGMARNTREQLLDAAEKLYAAQGLDGVSLRAILREAGQRNQSALQYHFGDREGLLAAIAERRAEQLETKRCSMLEAAMDTGHDPELRDLVAILLSANFELCRDDPSYRRLLGMLGPRQLASTTFLRRVVPATNSLEEIYRLIRATLLSRVDVDSALITLRADNANALGLLAICRRAKAQDSFRGRRAELFLNNLVDQVAAMLLAPVSPDTAALLRLQHPGIDSKI